MSEQDVMRLVAEVVDKYSGPLKDMQRSLKSLSETAKGSHETAGKAAREQAKHLRELHERFSKTKDFISGAFTPAMATLGIASFGASESINKVAEALRNAGERYNAFNDTMRRGGVSAQYTSVLEKTFEGLGMSADGANVAIGSIGETLDKLKRHSPEEMNRLTGMFGNTLPVLDGIVRGAKTREEAITRIAKAITDESIPIDQRRKVAEGLGIDPALAAKTGEEFGRAFRRAMQSEIDHPTNLNLFKRLDEAFTHLREAQENYRTDMVNTFGPAGIKIVDSYATAIEHVGKLQKDLWGNRQTPFDERSIFGRIAESLGLKAIGPKDPATRINEAFGAFDKKDTEETIAKGTAKGVIDAFQQWMSSTKDAQAFAGGLKPMAYHPDGDSPVKPGLHSGGGYSVLPNDDAGGGTAPRNIGGSPDAGGISGGIPEIIRRIAGNGSVGTAFDRTRFDKELSDKPWLKDKIFQLAAGEDRPSKGQSLLANQAVMETMMNRAIVRGTSLEAQAKWYGREAGGYYAGSPSHLTELERKNSEENMRKVLGGSNITDYATDNSSQGLAARERASGKFKYHTQYHGESFFSPGWAEPKLRDRYARLREQMEAEAAKERGHGAASLRDHIRHHGSLLKVGKQTGLIGPDRSTGGDPLGHAQVTVDFQNMPRGVRTKGAGSGVFKTVKLNRGRPMALASQDD